MILQSGFAKKIHPVYNNLILPIYAEKSGDKRIPIIVNRQTSSILDVFRALMRERLKQSQLTSRSGRTFILVVAIGFTISLVTGWDEITPITIIVALILTLIYLYMGLNDEAYFVHYTSPLATAVYFIIIIGLALSVQMLLTPGSSWLISLPIASLAVYYLIGWKRWLVYLAIMAGIAIPIGINFDWEQAFYFTLSFSPAIMFVVVFTNNLLSEQAAREKAEQLTSELESANQQLSAYATQAEELATTKERNRLAREIHDNLGHYLTVVNVQIKAAKAIMSTDPAKAQDALTKAQNLTEEGLVAIRQSVATLRESPLGERPLPTVIAEMVNDLQNSGIVTEFTLEGTYRKLDPKIELTLYRAVQESLTNVRKHAHASRVDLLLDYTQAAQVRLRIADNGVGATAVQYAGFGLLGLQERANQLDGRVDITTAPNNGFRLTLIIPTTEGDHDDSIAIG